MAPVQNTFTVVPNAPPGINDIRDGGAGSSNARMSRPPMTTKQVKKAYQKATRGPKLSKAEQRRQDLFEQDRIRKEFEKERNQARARAARDRKKEKEEQARAERKKKGLPLVDVRPSQDTIARFIRAKPSRQRDDSPVSQQNEGKRRSSSPAHDLSGKPDQIEQFEDADKENIPPSQKMTKCGHDPDNEFAALDHAGPPNKKRKVEVHEQEQVDKTPLSIPDAAGPRSSGCSAKQHEPNTHEDFLAIDFIEENVLDDLFRETEGVHSSSITPEGRIDGKQQHQNSPKEPPPPKPSELPQQRLPLKDSMRPTVSLSPHPTGLSTPNCFVAPSTTDVRKSQPTAPPSSRSFRHPKTPMAPPPIPPKFKTTKVSSDPPKAPQFAKPLLPTHANTGALNRPHTSKPEQTRRDEPPPPPSTQLFFLNHLDDFFPSPSQEVREIFEEPQRRTSGVGKPQMAPSGRKASKPTPYISKVSTFQHNKTVAPAQETRLRENRRIQRSAAPAESQKPAAQPCLQPLQPVTQNVACAFDMPFFSTQDVLLSSQDIKDIEEEPLPPPKPPTPAPAPSKSPTKSRDKPRRSSKPLFTSNCSELRYKYALERSRTAAWEGPSARQKAQEELDRLQALEDARLEALLADTGKEKAEKNSQSASIEGDATVPDAVGKESDLTLFATPPSPFSSPPSASWIELSCYNPLRQNDPGRRRLTPTTGETAPNHKQKPSDVRALRRENSGNSSGSGGGGGGGGQRNKPTKGYEAMLELLAKGPKQKSGAQNNENNNTTTTGNQTGTKYKKDAIGVGNGRRHTVQMTSNERQAAAATTTETTTNMKTTIAIPASQETDYDGGEEWDDDDLLRDMP